MKTLPIQLALGAALLIAPAHGQDQATTLLLAARAADVVVAATVEAASDPSPMFHRRMFRVDQRLRGEVSARFQLLEPAGACCGRCLFGLVEGETVLLFLRRTGPTLQPFGGSRGLLPATAPLVDHVAALLRAGEADLPDLLTTALAAEEPRIADDAAMALATLKRPALAPPERQRLLTALQHAAARHLTRLAPLAEAAARDGGPEALDRLLTTYLAAEPGEARLLRRALLRADADAVVDRLPLHEASGDGLRFAELLVELPMPTAIAAVQRLLAGPSHPRVQLCLAEALLQQQQPGLQLLAQLPAPVRKLAEARASTAPAFRSILPAGR